jgi:hypothetical protein
MSKTANQYSHRLSGYHNLPFRSGTWGDLPMIENKNDAAECLNRRVVGGKLA